LTIFDDKELTMNLWKRVQNFFGGEKSTPPPPPHLPIEDDEPEIVVPEITVEQLQTALSDSLPPLVIDVREPYEWRLVRMTAARHIPMNEIPAHLDSLPRDRPVIVMCAHGSRSYSVAAWLIEQGVDASSLAGGITQWASRGGAVEQG
jgi:rhodanese-related sulfurtransferase